MTRSAGKRLRVTARVGLLAVAALMALAVTGVFAGSSYSNARAEFERTSDGEAAGVALNARGHAIINYVKGQKHWLAHGRVTGLLPNEDYVVRIGMAGDETTYASILGFTTDSRGNANFRQEPLAPFPDEYTIVVIRHADTLEYHMEAWEDGSIGSLSFLGTGRGP